RDEQRQDHDLVEAVLEDLQDLHGEDRGDREHQQPHDAAAHDPEDRGGQVGARQRFGAGGAGSVLGGLLLEDVDPSSTVRTPTSRPSLSTIGIASSLALKKRRVTFSRSSVACAWIASW